VKPGLLLPVVTVAACASAAADHERLGDHAYREGRYPVAVAEYRAAIRGRAGAQVWAKLGSAALKDRQLGMAIEAFVELRRADPARTTEAAIGLERVAGAAERGGAADVLYLASAVRELRAIPGRPLGRWGLTPNAELSPSDAVGALPAILASAPSARTVDSLLLLYGEAQRTTTACEAAIRTYRTVVRRSGLSAQRAAAGVGIGACGLRLGLDALRLNQGELAEQWFESAVQAVPASPVGWRAEIGLGDARLLQGDVLGAALAYQSILSVKGMPDSLSALARAKLDSLGGSPPESRGS
jgi:tetratricopeptide (TPR) repeat protein